MGNMNLPLLLYRGNHFNANFYYFAKCDIDHAFLLLEKGCRTLLVPKLNETLACEVFDGDVIAYDNPIAQIKKQIRHGAVGVDGQSISMALFEKLAAFCKPKDISRKLYEQRAVKNADEIKNIAHAAKITKRIFASLDFSKMKTESDVKKTLLAQTLERGLEPAYEPIVATDRNSSFPHYNGKDGNNVKLGKTLLIDYAVRYKHYCADITRCFFLDGSKENKQKKEQYEILQGMTDAIVANMKKFKTGGDIAAYSEDLFNEHMLPKPVHSIGHGVGLDIHEAPRLRRGSKDRLAGATIAVEPAVYFKSYGLRYEETVYFDGKKARIL